MSKKKVWPQLQDALHRFAWAGRRAPLRLPLYLPRNAGGFGLPHLPTRQQAMRLDLQRQALEQPQAPWAAGFRQVHIQLREGSGTQQPHPLRLLWQKVRQQQGGVAATPGPCRLTAHSAPGVWEDTVFAHTALLGVHKRQRSTDTHDNEDPTTPPKAQHTR